MLIINFFDANVSDFKDGLGFLRQVYCKNKCINDGAGCKRGRRHEIHCGEQQEWSTMRKKTGGDSRLTVPTFNSLFNELDSCCLHRSDSSDRRILRKL